MTRLLRSTSATRITGSLSRGGRRRRRHYSLSVAASAAAAAADAAVSYYAITVASPTNDFSFHNTVRPPPTPKPTRTHTPPPPATRPDSRRRLLASGSPPQVPQLTTVCTDRPVDSTSPAAPVDAVVVGDADRDFDSDLVAIVVDDDVCALPLFRDEAAELDDDDVTAGR
uniref:Uncharacterized protein n=1 Tax=Plectus sambesii TaxID=2011161 RepID=A0A914VGH6_9BILA